MKEEHCEKRGDLLFNDREMKVVLCKECKGHGFVIVKGSDESVAVTCPLCEGEGRVVKHSVVTHIPLKRFPELAPPKDGGFPQSFGTSEGKV